MEEDDNDNEASLMRDDNSVSSDIAVKQPALVPVSAEDLIQKFLNNPSLLQQLQLTQKAQTAANLEQAQITTPMQLLLLRDPPLKTRIPSCKDAPNSTLYQHDCLALRN
jgi:hypothetical protein